MTFQSRGVDRSLAQLFYFVERRLAFLRSGYALRSAVGVGIFAICHASLQHESARQGGNSRLVQWGQGCLWGAITVLTGVTAREMAKRVIVSTQIVSESLKWCQGGLR